MDFDDLVDKAKELAEDHEDELKETGRRRGGHRHRATAASPTS